MAKRSRPVVEAAPPGPGPPTHGLKPLPLLRFKSAKENGSLRSANTMKGWSTVQFSCRAAASRAKTKWLDNLQPWHPDLVSQQEKSSNGPVGRWRDRQWPCCRAVPSLSGPLPHWQWSRCKCATRLSRWSELHSGQAESWQIPNHCSPTSVNRGCSSLLDV